MDRTANVFSPVAGASGQEVVEALAGACSVRIERIVSRGHSSPEGFWYDQETDEWVIVLRGHARLRFEAADDLVEMGPGDHLHIPAHCRHRVDWTAPDGETVWLAVHFPPAVTEPAP